MGTSATAWCAIQGWIEARQALDTIIYGQRTLQAMGGRDYGCTAEWGAPAWAIRQWDEAKAAAARFGFDLSDGAAAWRLKQAKKAAQDALKAAAEEKREIGTARQIRLALAA